ncbi:two-component system sensor histidine kinase MtrB [Terracoccus luteus]|jgi:two-component system sensor histidine kinase MtrB|uniref:Sensor histidine kinase MtrB n=1 Tax=Terracoccus luteus TaxID=53356 RepID=A0A495XVE8_9MICO|nr:MtrAB system histidine kinase MtrB [Terracoccus luteus]RKT78541.1 two-component system sensor histidine kinase MtrB [Terracoccus luteus]
MSAVTRVARVEGGHAGPGAGGPDAGRPGRVRRLASGAWSLLRRLGSRLVHLWRASLAFRVVMVTMLLGILVLTAVGTYLYGSIGQGLVDSRQRIASQDSLRDATAAQQLFDRNDKNATQAELSQSAQDIVNQYQRNTGNDVRYVVLSRLETTTAPVVVNTVDSGVVGLREVPEDLRRAVAQAPDRQHLQLTSLGEGRSAISAVVVGQKVTLPVAGNYGLYFIYPMDREREIIDFIGQTFLLAGIALILLVGAIAFVVTRLVADPVRRAAVVAERFADGNLGERMRARGEDDLARLGNSFNAMAASIQQQIGQLENLSRVQQRFVSDVSHELRTPLTTIRMAADLIHDSRAHFEPTVARSSELLYHELDRFESLLTDLLEISRFDAGAASLEVEATDVRASIERAVDAHRTLAARKGTALVITQPDEPVIAEMDSRRIERILRNLVSNAVEHGEGRPIEVTVAGNDSAVAVTVRDHGVGLRPGEAALVFTRFWRADPARARTTGGTGLGLAIALEDARLHAGRLEAWGALGEGSCFRLTLPRQADATITSSPLPLSPLAAEAAAARALPAGAAGPATTNPAPTTTPADRHPITSRPGGDAS